MHLVLYSGIENIGININYDVKFPIAVRENMNISNALDFKPNAQI